MVTIGKSDRCPAFGRLKPAADLHDTEIELTEIGDVIDIEIYKTPLYHKEVKVIASVVMPDHVHVLVFVTQNMLKPLGHIIQGLKAGITSRVRQITGVADMQVFEDGFHDRIVREQGQLDILHKYIRNNPYRLAVRLANPQFFSKITRLTFGGTDFSAYGNLQLLDNPFKE